MKKKEKISDIKETVAIFLVMFLALNIFMLFCWLLLILFPLQLIIWLLNKKSFDDTPPYSELFSFTEIFMDKVFPDDDEHDFDYY